MHSFLAMKLSLAFATVLTLLSLTGPAMGDALPRCYYQDEGVVQFQESPSVQSFENVAAEYQPMILAELLSEPNLTAKMSNLREVLMSRHFYSLPPDTQADVLGRAFALAVESGSIDHANQIFQSRVQNAPHLGAKFICRTLTSVQDRGVEYDPEIMTAFADRMASLVPLVRAHPEIADQTCDISFRNDVMDRISIRKMLTDASPEFGKYLPPPQVARALNMPSTTPVQAGAGTLSCDKKNLEFHFTNTERVLKRFPKGGRSFIEINLPGCLISGQAIKTGNGKYEFVNNLKWKDNEKVKFEFTNAADAAEKYLRTK